MMKLDYQLGMIMMASYGIILCGILWDDYGILWFPIVLVVILTHKSGSEASKILDFAWKMLASLYKQFERELQPITCWELGNITIHHWVNLC